MRLMLILHRILHSLILIILIALLNTYYKKTRYILLQKYISLDTYIINDKASSLSFPIREIKIPPNIINISILRLEYNSITFWNRNVLIVYKFVSDQDHISDSGVNDSFQGSMTAQWRRPLLTLVQELQLTLVQEQLRSIAWINNG